MFPNWQLVSLSVVYIALLFLIAYLGDKYRQRILRSSQPLIYALTLGVYCTSWSFLGTTGQAATNPFSYLPIYIGPIILFVFAWPFLQRMIRVSIRQNLTSVADLLAARFGKSHKLAILVTVVSLVGTMPYIALQLKAIVYSYQQLQAEKDLDVWQLGLAVSLILAGFTIVFGIRNIDVTERHPGVMLAIAFESLVKLVAFLAIGIFVAFIVFDSPLEIVNQAPVDYWQLITPASLTGMAGLLVIVMAAFLSLPRQFQVMVVELRDVRDTWLSRWVFPLYLLVFAVFAAPLGQAGQILLGDSVSADAYVLILPWHEGQTWLTLFSFLGAVSAASSMVIISSIALSTMLSNEIVFLFMYRALGHNQTQYEQFRTQLLNIRKVLVVFVILLGYGAFLLAPPDTLSSLGEVAFGALAQLTPALLAAFYWRKSSLLGVFGGISVGFGFWCLLSFFPQLGLYRLPEEGILGSNTVVTLFSLWANVFTMWLLSEFTRQTVQERVQASRFLEWKLPDSFGRQKSRQLNIEELQLLASRFVGNEKVDAEFSLFRQGVNRKSMGTRAYNQALLQLTENTLASVMGASSARLVLSSALEGRDIDLDELAVLVEEASSQKQQYSQDLLRSAIENASEGISIVDSDLKLVAWNQKYLDLFNYPDELVYVGSPIENLIQFNAERGLCGQGDVREQVQKRLEYLRQGSSHSSERTHSDGQVILIEGNPLPGGGFVMMFSDITDFRKAEKVLREANLDLESRVEERTRSLAEANSELAQARARAEQAHVRKTQYLRACSHDLMQPLEAARLFASALDAQESLTETQRRQVTNINNSLQVASQLLANLGEIARIEGGTIKPVLERFPINELFDELEREFAVSAIDQRVDFRVVHSECWVMSDRHLLRRILQNLLGNAFRYASPGEVLLGARVVRNDVEIQVVDHGPGIPADKQELVFEQFTQLDSPQGGTSQGLGLGLSISKSLASLLGHPIHLHSIEGQGCVFSLSLPLAEKRLRETAKPASGMSPGLQGVRVLCVDNDAAVLEGMEELLSTWQCQVYAAESDQEAREIFTRHHDVIDIMLVDYQLENNRDGLSLIDDLRKKSSHSVPVVLITAAVEDDLEDRARSMDVEFMRKPVKPAMLRALMSAKLAQQLRDNYLH